MLFDTHAHLNFAAFNNNFDTVIKQSQKSGVKYLIIPGSNIENSKRGVEIAQKYDGVFAAVGIHPFHLFGHIKYGKGIEEDFLHLEKLLTEEKVVAVGEVGLDRHPYKSKKYPDYEISDKLIELQKEVFIKQIKLALKHKKTLMIHNRGMVKDLLEILSPYAKQLSGKAVLHFCETDERLLEFAKKYHFYIGVDGDVTYDPAKQGFVKKIPLELLVLETDSPYIIPEPLKSQGETTNTPENLKRISVQIAKIKNVTENEVDQSTTTNSRKLFFTRDY